MRTYTLTHIHHVWSVWMLVRISIFVCLLQWPSRFVGLAWRLIGAMIPIHRRLMSSLFPVCLLDWPGCIFSFFWFDCWSTYVRLRLCHCSLILRTPLSLSSVCGQLALFLCTFDTLHCAAEQRQFQIRFVELVEHEVWWWQWGCVILLTEILDET